MKLAAITNSFAHTGGGLVGAVSGLTHGIKSLGSDVSVAAYADGEVAADWEGLPLLPINARRFAGVHFFGTLEKILSEQAPDVVHAHGLWLRSSAQSHNWCMGRRVPYIISPHGMLDPWAVRNSAWKKKMAGYWYEYQHLNDAACLHALCLSEAESIRSFGQKNPVCIIPNGITIPTSSGCDDSAPWVCDRGRKVLLFLGRVHPKKGLPLLLEAWNSLKGRSIGDDWFLAIAGWSEVGHREELEAQVESLDLTHDIELVGALHGDKKAAALSHASAFVLPSYSEGLPMSILEAWSYKLPVLMTPECNLPEGYAHHAALRLDTNVAGVTEGLDSLLEMSVSELCAMGENGYSLVEQKFVWSQIAAKMVEVYEWILGGGDPPESVQC